MMKAVLCYEQILLHIWNYQRLLGTAQKEVSLLYNQELFLRKISKKNAEATPNLLYVNRDFPNFAL
jgi:hypothetical protein